MSTRRATPRAAAPPLFACLLCICIAVFTFCSPISVAGQDTRRYWVGGVNGLWGNAANWSPAGVPGVNDSITINASVSVVVKEIAVQIYSLDLSNGATLMTTEGNFTASYVKSVHATLDIAGTFHLPAAGTFTNSSIRVVSADVTRFLSLESSTFTVLSSFTAFTVMGDGIGRSSTLDCTQCSTLTITNLVESLGNLITGHTQLYTPPGCGGAESGQNIGVGLWTVAGETDVYGYPCITTNRTYGLRDGATLGLNMSGACNVQLTTPTVMKTIEGVSIKSYCYASISWPIEVENIVSNATTAQGSVVNISHALLSSASSLVVHGYVNFAYVVFNAATDMDLCVGCTEGWSSANVSVDGGNGTATVHTNWTVHGWLSLGQSLTVPNLTVTMMLNAIGNGSDAQRPVLYVQNGLFIRPDEQGPPFAEAFAENFDLQCGNWSFEHVCEGLYFWSVDWGSYQAGEIVIAANDITIGTQHPPRFGDVVVNVGKGIVSYYNGYPQVSSGGVAAARQKMRESFLSGAPIQSRMTKQLRAAWNKKGGEEGRREGGGGVGVGVGLNITTSEAEYTPSVLSARSITNGVWEVWVGDVGGCPSTQSLINIGSIFGNFSLYSECTSPASSAYVVVMNGVVGRDYTSHPSLVGVNLQWNQTLNVTGNFMLNNVTIIAQTSEADIALNGLPGSGTTEPASFLRFIATLSVIPINVLCSPIVSPSCTLNVKGENPVSCASGAHVPSGEEVTDGWELDCPAQQQN